MSAGSFGQCCCGAGAEGQVVEARVFWRGFEKLTQNPTVDLIDTKYLTNTTTISILSGDAPNQVSLDMVVVLKFHRQFADLYHILITEAVNGTIYEYLRDDHDVVTETKSNCWDASVAGSCVTNGLLNVALGALRGDVQRDESQPSGFQQDGDAMTWPTGGGPTAPWGLGTTYFGLYPPAPFPQPTKPGQVTVTDTVYSIDVEGPDGSGTYFRMKTELTDAYSFDDARADAVRLLDLVAFDSPDTLYNLAAVDNATNTLIPARFVYDSQVPSYPGQVVLNSMTVTYKRAAYGLLDPAHPVRVVLPDGISFLGGKSATLDNITVEPVSYMDWFASDREDEQRYLQGRKSRWKSVSYGCRLLQQRDQQAGTSVLKIDGVVCVDRARPVNSYTFTPKHLVLMPDGSQLEVYITGLLGYEYVLRTDSGAFPAPNPGYPFTDPVALDCCNG